MPITPHELDAGGHAFLTENHLASLTTTFPSGRFHVVPVAPIWVADDHTIRIVTRVGSVKAGNAERGAEGAVSMVDGGRWMSLHGRTIVRDDPDRVADTIARYTAQRHPPRGEFDRLSLEIQVDLIRGRWS